MRTVYLRNGTAVYLHEEVSGGRYLVEPIYLYDDFAGENVSEGGTGEMQIVTEIYNKAPVELVDAEFSMACDKLEKMNEEIIKINNEKYKLSHQIEETQRTIVNNEKFIINKSELRNAKRIALFPKDEIMPWVMDKDLSALKISFNFRINENGERSWGYKIYKEVSVGYQHDRFLDEKYGVMVNPTDDEIEERIRVRLSELTFSEREMDDIDHKYLTEAQITAKRERKAAETAQSIAKQEQAIKQAQDAILKLKGE